MQRLRAENQKQLTGELTNWIRNHIHDFESHEATTDLCKIVDKQANRISAQKINLSAESFPALFRSQYPRSRE